MNIDVLPASTVDTHPLAPPPPGGGGGGGVGPMLKLLWALAVARVRPTSAVASAALKRKTFMTRGLYSHMAGDLILTVCPMYVP
jgi:hypothetical protein